MPEGILFASDVHPGAIAATYRHLEQVGYAPRFLHIDGAWRDPAAPLPRGLLQDAFVAQAHSRPQAVALCWQEQGSCSYGQLLRQVQAVAQRHFADTRLTTGVLVPEAVANGAAR